MINPKKYTINKSVYVDCDRCGYDTCEVQGQDYNLITLMAFLNDNKIDYTIKPNYKLYTDDEIRYEGKDNDDFKFLVDIFIKDKLAGEFSFFDEDGDELSPFSNSYEDLILNIEKIIKDSKNE